MFIEGLLHWTALQRVAVHNKSVSCYKDKREKVETALAGWVSETEAASEERSESELRQTLDCCLLCSLCGRESC